MKKTLSILILLSGVLIFLQCKKETGEWVFCDCGIDTWVGVYSGGGNYYKDGDEAEDHVDVRLTLEQITPKKLKMDVHSPDLYFESFYSIKDDSTYFIMINGANKSLSLNLKKKDGQLKISGTSKNYYWKIEDDSTYLVIDKTLSFEVIRENQ